MTLSSERRPAHRSGGGEPAWWIVAPPPTGPFDGIVDFSRELAAAINTIEPARLISSHAGLAEGAGQNPSGIFLQYSPPAFVTADLPKLLSDLSRLRARGVPIVTTVHEYWSPATLSPKLRSGGGCASARCVPSRRAAGGLSPPRRMRRAFLLTQAFPERGTRRSCPSARGFPR